MDDEKTIIGKHILGSLTTSMYTNPLFIYREYIQNAADQIDALRSQGANSEKKRERIIVQIDKTSREITILDYATGVQSAKFVKTLKDIADSRKDAKRNKGFRGIGRLGGLAYCEKLIFETSYPGETKKSRMTWDASKLRKRISDSRDGATAVDIVDAVTRVEHENCASEEYYFKVILRQVLPEREDLLDEETVRDYISKYCPVSFDSAKFPFASKIEKYAASKGHKMDVYDIRVNGESVYKPYKRTLKGQGGIEDDVVDISFFDFRDEKTERFFAWGWVALTKFSTALVKSENPVRGIFLRKANILIGNEDTLSVFHPEDRGNNYFIGEIHAIDEELIPNSSREYFDKNRACEYFESKIRAYFKDRLLVLYRNANRYKGNIRKTNTAIVLAQNLKKASFPTEKQKKEAIKNLAIQKAEADKARKENEKLSERNQIGDAMTTVFTAIERALNVAEKFPDVLPEPLTDSPNTMPYPKGDGLRKPIIPETFSDETKKTLEIVAVVLKMKFRQEMAYELLQQIVGMIENDDE